VHAGLEVPISSSYDLSHTEYHIETHRGTALDWLYWPAERRLTRSKYKYKYKYNSYFYCTPYSLTDGTLQKSANTCFTAVGRLK